MLPNPIVVSNCVSEIILSIILVETSSALSLNVIWSPIFNWVVNLVPLPRTVSEGNDSKPIASPTLPEVPVSITILSPASVLLPSVPFNAILPDKTSLPVDINPVNWVLSPKTLSRETFEV